MILPFHCLHSSLASLPRSTHLTFLSSSLPQPASRITYMLLFLVCAHLVSSLFLAPPYALSLLSYLLHHLLQCRIRLASLHAFICTELQQQHRLQQQNPGTE